ncbi:MAG TPA: hypothetical protein VEY11_14895 [Pyrinomonadaceae bacterium]|nr:hypothetical protein [Pyrinomonadaceae bacterium]
MNCRQFTSLIVEAARGCLLDAAARDGAMRHADACGSCAARLAQEQSLTSALRTFAGDMKELGAPASVEAKLLAAFKESHADAQTATVAETNDPHTHDSLRTHGATHAPVALLNSAESSVESGDELAARRASARRRMQRAAFMATAIAASLALVALVALYRQFTHTAPSKEITKNNAPSIIALPIVAPPAVAPPSGTTTPATVADASGASFKSSASAGSAQTAKHDRARATQSDSSAQTAQGDRSRFTRGAGAERASAKLARHAAVPRMIASRGVIDGGHAIFAPGEDEPADESELAGNNAGGAARTAEAESMTEFIPLVSGAPAAPPLESGQLVRVQLPRAALSSLGLPLNAERGDEPVKADVLLGGDGLARAIRFVR